MNPWLIFIIGLVMGMMIWDLAGRFRKKDGVLKIDHSNPAKDVYRFEVSDLDKLDSRTQITLTIDHNAKLSQE